VPQCEEARLRSPGPGRGAGISPLSFVVFVIFFDRYDATGVIRPRVLSFASDEPV